jgi:hypothetical protein
VHPVFAPAIEQQGGGKMADYRELSFWFDSPGHGHWRDGGGRPRPALAWTDRGCRDRPWGLTGLWTAYYLSSAEPNLRIAVPEKHIAGFRASGRNGGWCSALFPRIDGVALVATVRDAAIAMRQAMIDTVDEVGRASIAEGIDCDFVKGGNGEPRSRRGSTRGGTRRGRRRWALGVDNPDEGCRPQPARGNRHVCWARPSIRPAPGCTRRKLVQGAAWARWKRRVMISKRPR